MSLSPTPEQEACIAAARRGGSLMISAYAGCAKSSTLEMMAPGVKEPTLALAFNKKIADELGRRLPANFTAKTLNSLGHGAWVRANRSIVTWELNDRKMTKIVSEVTGAKADRYLWEPTMAAARAAMVQGIVPTDMGQGLVADDLETWSALADCDEEDLEQVVELAREALRRDIIQARQGVISFDDQVYCPTLLGGQWPRFPRVFGDEVQDWSPLNLAMIGHCLRAGGSLAVVGDRLQSIYAFRGADSEAMTKVRSLAQAWTDLPLTLTFRCPKAIVARQQAHAPGYRAWESNPPGRIEEWIDGWGPRQLAQGMTVLCRNVSPLMKLAFRLLRAGVGCQVAGRDIGRSLIALSRKIIKDDDARPTQIVEAILRWRSAQSEIAIARDQMEKLESIQDRAEALMAVLESSGASTAGDLRTMLEQLFARESGAVLLSTIHRAKGLEWPRVMHLDPWRIPSRQASRLGGPALQQEANLRYVAETRTQELLVLANLEDWRPGPG